MTDPIIRLETTQLTVEPGGQGRTLVTVRNLGNIVEGFALQVLGEGVSEWSEVTPAEVQVYPEQEATAVVVFSPPAGNTTRSGSFPFAVRAESVVDPDVSAVAEGDLEIGRVFGLQTKITPVTSSGRWRGKHFLEITNWGNAPVQLKLTATDPGREAGVSDRAGTGGPPARRDCARAIAGAHPQAVPARRPGAACRSSWSASRIRPKCRPARRR